MSENRDLLIRVARQLGPLRAELVFVGGATVELYFTDPASDRVRPTVDADAICEVTGYAEYYRFGERLRSLGFRQDMPDPIYRWRIGSDVLDVMPTDERVLGFSNRWYAPAIRAAQTVLLEPDLSILVPPPPVFLAAKLAAHENRGLADPLTSQDLEDVVALLANRPELSDEVAATDRECRPTFRIGSPGFSGTTTKLRSYRPSCPRRASYAGSSRRSPVESGFYPVDVLWIRPALPQRPVPQPSQSALTARRLEPPDVANEGVEAGRYHRAGEQGLGLLGNRPASQ